VTGNELSIKKILRKSLVLLLEDADQDSNIVINILSNGTLANIELCNHGVGVPTWHIENAIHNTSHRKADKSALQQLADEIAESDLALSITSTLCDGYRVTMAIPIAAT
jgi:hypothetical protein